VAIGFASEVSNDGPGYFKITGNAPATRHDRRPARPDERRQRVDRRGDRRDALRRRRRTTSTGTCSTSSATSCAEPTTPTPPTPLLKDQKTGFCLANSASPTDICGRNHPDWTTVLEGINPGGSDVYLGYLEGQYIPDRPHDGPDGRLPAGEPRQPAGALLDGSSTDDVATVPLSIKWGLTSPVIKVTNSCAASVACPARSPSPT
jgi:hypothetical protein